MAQRTFSFKQYRAMDLVIFGVLLCVLETVISILAKKWVDTLYIVSLLYAVVAITMMRWGWWSVIYCVLGGLIQCIVNGANVWQYVSYIGGNCCAMLVLLFRHYVGRKRVRDNIWLTLAYILLIYLSICIGRASLLALTALIQHQPQNYFKLLGTCIATDSLSFALTIVIVFIARMQKGLFEDQKDYLRRTEEERQQELQNSQHKDII